MVDRPYQCLKTCGVWTCGVVNLWCCKPIVLWYTVVVCVLHGWYAVIMCVLHSWYTIVSVVSVVSQSVSCQSVSQLSVSQSVVSQSVSQLSVSQSVVSQSVSCQSVVIVVWLEGCLLQSQWTVVMLFVYCFQWFCHLECHGRVEPAPGRGVLKWPGGWFGY
jgi:hypothetical protein